jgi:hypothetical protein
MSNHTTYTCILCRDDKPIASGFLVHIDGLIATCHHVVQAAQPSRLTLRALKSKVSVRVVPIVSNAEHDVALLQISGTVPDGLTPCKLIQSTAVESGKHEFALTAYGALTDKEHGYDFLSATGKIEGIVRRSDVEMLQLNSNKILRGMSGAPISVSELGGVVGLLSARYNIDPKNGMWMEGTAWAARIESLLALDDRLKVESPHRPNPQTNQGSNVVINKASRGGRIINVSGGTYNENNLSASDPTPDSEDE